jgi:hypothetical protein
MGQRYLKSMDMTLNLCNPYIESGFPIPKLLQSEPVIPVSGLLTFDSIPELRMYVRQLLSYYEKQFDLYSQKVGALMRLYEKEQKGSENRRFKDDNWEKVGMLMVNKRNSMLGTLEIMLEAMEEYKVKMSRTNEVLVSFEDLEQFSSPEGASVTLYLRNGVPMRIVFDSVTRKAEVAALATNR